MKDEGKRKGIAAATPLKCPECVPKMLDGFAGKKDAIEIER